MSEKKGIMGKKICINGRQAFDEYILVAPGSDYGRAMWSDIDLLQNGTVLDSILRPTNKLISILHHIHFSFAINRKIQLPFQSVWSKFYSIEAITLDKSKRYCIIYTDVSAARTDYKYLKSLSARDNVTLVLTMVNTMARRKGLLEKRFQYFHIIFSFDEQDAQKYGFIYHPTNYSMVNILDVEKVKYDAFYVGVSKGRAEALADIYNTLMNGGANAEFYIAGIKKNEKRRNGIHYNKWLSYQQVLKNIQQSNCIVEVMDENQKGVTLRTMEAICYNKKLLTNNLLMKQSKYYETGNIQVFVTPDEIDIEFVKDRCPVEYGYNGEFSPVHLLEHINKIVIDEEGE